MDPKQLEHTNYCPVAQAWSTGFTLGVPEWGIKTDPGSVLMPHLYIYMFPGIISFKLTNVQGTSVNVGSRYNSEPSLLQKTTISCVAEGLFVCIILIVIQIVFEKNPNTSA